MPPSKLLALPLALFVLFPRPASAYEATLNVYESEPIETVYPEPPEECSIDSSECLDCNDQEPSDADVEEFINAMMIEPITDESGVDEASPPPDPAPEGSPTPTYQYY